MSSLIETIKTDLPRAPDELAAILVKLGEHVCHILAKDPAPDLDHAIMSALDDADDNREAGETKEYAENMLDAAAHILAAALVNTP
jgi:hypothetical protein